MTLLADRLGYVQLAEPVSPVRFRASDLAAQDRDLMPQYRDLHVLRGVAASEQRQPAEHPGS